MATAPPSAKLDTARRDTIDQLILNYGHGRLPLDEFEQRLDRALDAATTDALAVLIADLEPIAATNRAHTPPVPSESTAPKDVEHLVHVFGGSTRSGPWTVAPEIRMLNVFGGGELDFTAARFSSSVTRVKLFCLFGGATIYVPEGVNAVSKAICIFGGVDNSAPSYGDGRPTVIVEGVMVFGGAQIKLKKPLKDRLLELAHSVRQMFGPAR